MELHNLYKLYVNMCVLFVVQTCCIAWREEEMRLEGCA